MGSNTVWKSRVELRNERIARVGRPSIPISERNKPVTITLTPTVVEMLRADAEKTGLTVSAYIARLIVLANDDVSKRNMSVFLERLVCHLQINGAKSMLLGQGMDGWGGFASVQNGPNIGIMWIERGVAEQNDRVFFRWNHRLGDDAFYAKLQKPVDVSSWSEKRVFEMISASATTNSAQA